MKPIPLNRTPDFPAPETLGGYDCPRVFLDRLPDVDIPEEGEIRFRFSRVRKTTTEDLEGESSSYELKLKAITDICDCKGRDAENNEPEEEDEGPEDAEEALEELMEKISDKDMEDESEDDNPDKY